VVSPLGVGGDGMTRVRTNILANFAGSFWTSLLGVAFVPVYIQFLGVEVYGLIGAFVIIQATSSLLDAGMSTTLNRELAYASAQERPRDVRDLARSLTTIYWAIGVGICALVAAAAPVLAHHWLRPEGLSPDVVVRGLVLMATNFALYWPATLYGGGLQGLQRHVILNWALGASATVRGVGAVAVLAFVSPTIEAFFGWQIAVSAAHTGLLHWLLWPRIPGDRARRSRFSWAELRRVWRFAAGMSGIGVLVVLITQLDKVLLSRLLTLEMFGYYAFAGMVAMALTRLSQPLFSALFPRFTELVGQGDEALLARTYHRGCQLAAVVLIAPATVIAFFSPEILWLWTRNAELVANTHLVLSLLVIGTALNGLLMMPAALQVAHGWTRLLVVGHITALVVLGPVIIAATLRWGSVGAAGAWTALNVGYMALIPLLMHRRLLPRERSGYFVHDLGLPLVGALTTAGTLRWLFPSDGSDPVTLLLLLGTSAFVLMVTGLSVPLVREQVRRVLQARLPIGAGAGIDPAGPASSSQARR
jgi:O-antigen/teichoic acid export membrane protein